MTATTSRIHSGTPVQPRREVDPDGKGYRVVVDLEPATYSALLGDLRKYLASDSGHLNRFVGYLVGTPSGDGYDRVRLRKEIAEAMHERGLTSVELDAEQAQELAFGLRDAAAEPDFCRECFDRFALDHGYCRRCEPGRVAGVYED